MLIYWDDPSTKQPSPQAEFHLFPFFSKPPITTKQQISNLNPFKPFELKSISHFPNKLGWTKAVERALLEIKKERVEKVVLARKTVIECPQEIDPKQILSYLKSTTQNRTIFGIIKEDEAFLGASPERLFSRDRDRIILDAMAGTRRRGRDEREDLKLERELLLSQKDFREWSPIQFHFLNQLPPFCISPLEFTPLCVYKAEKVQHLHSRCKGILKRGMDDFSLIQALHPTPALAGYPQKEALELIQELECFDRNYYGGVVGFQEEDHSEYVVSIRSCRVSQNFMEVYAGTGIVEGSDPDSEWQELNFKTKHYMELFNG